MNKTKIEWVVNPDGTQGYTWNPIAGCSRGCNYCYARKIAMRFQGSFEPKFHPERLNGPLKIKKPSTIFVGSMTDVFGDWVPPEWIEQVFEVVKKCPQHRFLFLTKNGTRMNRVSRNLENCWYGQTHTGNGEASYEIINRKQFISFEPLLGEEVVLLSNEKWIIIGALNSNGKSCYTKKEWVLNLIEQADNFKIPVFIKDSLYKLYPDLPKRRYLVAVKRKGCGT